MQGRGVDFEHRFKASRWAEDRLFESLGHDTGLIAVRFGLSEVRPEDAIKYDKLGIKEPDLLVMPINKLTEEELRRLVELNHDLSNSDRALFDLGADLHFVIAKGIAAFEVEFSPYKATQMAGRNWSPKSKEQWERRPLRRAEPPKAPNIWVKEEDLERLSQWETLCGIPIIVAHLFDEEGFAIPLGTVLHFSEMLQARPEKSIELQNTMGIFRKEQSYDRIDAQGAGEKKIVFVTTPNVATKIGDLKDVKVTASLGLSKSQKYVSQVLFEGGKLTLTDEFKRMLLR